MSLTTETIQACTNTTSYERGLKYYKQGRVVDFTQTGAVAEATVVGTDKYHVSLDTANLEEGCTCYVAGGDIWCKHVVALALTIANGTVHATEQPAVKNSGKKKQLKADTLEQELGAQAANTLAGIIKTAADTHPDIWDIVERVLYPPTISTPRDILALVKKAFAPVERARSWERQVDAAIRATEDMEYIAGEAPASEASVRGLLQAAVWAYSRLDHLDDSDGELQDGIAALVNRAITVVNAQHAWTPLLYEPLSQKTDLPLIDDILSSGDQHVQENCVQRLDKHRNARDQNLAAIDRERVEYILLHHYANHGDTRLFDLLEDASFHENTRLHALVAYHGKRGEWQEVVTLLWPKRGDEYYHRPLREALQAVGDTDKLIIMQTDEVLALQSPNRALPKLEHMLKTAGRSAELPAIIEEILTKGRLSYESRLDLLLKLKRFNEAAVYCLQVLAKPPVSYMYNAPVVADVIANFAQKLSAVSAQDGLTVWRELFTQEKGRVTTSSNYTRFTLYCEKLHAAGDNVWLRPQLINLITTYPTRKKLVTICEQFVR